MAINTRDITPEESIAEQLQEFVLEANTHYAESSRIAAERMIPHLQEKKALDLGCGDGAATRFFDGIEVTGVDVNKEKLKYNKTNTINDDMVSYLAKQPDNSVPNIFSHHALEHLPNPQDVLNIVGKKLKPGGIVYFEVPANDYIHSVHHATFDSPQDLLPPGLDEIESGSDGTEHYMIARKPWTVA